MLAATEPRGVEAEFVDEFEIGAHMMGLGAFFNSIFLEKNVCAFDFFSYRQPRR